jgi:Holliday junction resolvase RusA-like endonuclease
MDALNNVVYDDDKQIVELHVYKTRHSELPRTEVFCRPI